MTIAGDTAQGARAAGHAALRDLAATAAPVLLVCAAIASGIAATRVGSGVLAVAAALLAAVLAGVALGRPVRR